MHVFVSWAKFISAKFTFTIVHDDYNYTDVQFMN